MTLRARLIVILSALLGIGLIVSGALTYESLRHFLFARLDQQLRSSQPYALKALVGSLQGLPPPETDSGELPLAAYADLRDTTGHVIDKPITFGPAKHLPALPNPLPSDPASHDAFTVGATDDSSYKFRVLEAKLSNGDKLVVAIPMQDAQETLHRLLLVDAIVALALLAATGGGSWFLVRRELRPLERMSEAAAEIAAGDLTARVETIDARTEVGTLSQSLNQMLEHIEQAFEAKRESEERMRQFLADASHELRTPLTSIRGYAELFRRGADQRPADLRVSMRRIEEEAARMGVLVEDLLLLARVDSTRPLERVSVDLRDIVMDAASDARAQAPDRTISVNAEAPVVVSADEDRLRQAVANLMTNALVHTPPDAAIELGLAKEPGGASITVTDWGPGLDKEMLAHAFDRFWRGDPSRARTSGGVGLGLAIVDAIARAHGGRVTVENRVGAGASFSIYIPIDGAEGGEDLTEGEASDATAQAGATTA